MKLFFLSFLCLFAIGAGAQTYTTQTVIQSVVSERKIYLNGGLNASLGGKSRTVIPVRLPQGTKSWYYSFSTSAGKSGTQNLNLLMQLSALLTDQTGITRSAVSNLQIPAGAMNIEAYLMDQYNADQFINKADLNGGQYRYSREGSVTSTRQAVVPVYNVTAGIVYIGLKNPAALDGVNVAIEVVAEVNTRVYEDTWTANNIDLIFNNCLQRFAVRNTETEQVCNCFKDKITTDLSPSGYNKLSVSERNKLYQTYTADCSAETGNRSVFNKDSRIKEILELQRGQNIAKDYAGLQQSYTELIDLGIKTWQVYNGLGFCQLCLKKYDEAKQTLTIGLGKNPTDLFLLGNLGDYYLLTGQYSMAMEIFLAHKNERLEDRRRFKEAVADDLKEFERLGLSNPDFEKARKELGIR